jgi:hypothetical protein
MLIAKCFFSASFLLFSGYYICFFHLMFSALGSWQMFLSVRIFPTLSTKKKVSWAFAQFFGAFSHFWHHVASQHLDNYGTYKWFIILSNSSRLVLSGHCFPRSLVSCWWLEAYTYHWLVCVPGTSLFACLAQCCGFEMTFFQTGSGCVVKFSLVPDSALDLAWIHKSY